MIYLIFNYNHVFCDGKCEVFFFKKTFFLEEFENIKSQRDVTKMLHVHYLSFLRHKNASIVNADLLDLNIIDVFSRTNLMSTDTLRFFLKSILESHCHFLLSYFKCGEQKSIKNKVQNNF